MIYILYHHKSCEKILDCCVHGKAHRKGWIFHLMFVSSVFSVPPNSLQTNCLCWCTISNSDNQNRCKQSGHMTVTLTYRHTVGWRGAGWGGEVFWYHTRQQALLVCRLQKRSSRCTCTDTITRHTVVCFCVCGFFFFGFFLGGGGGRGDILQCRVTNLVLQLGHKSLSKA